MIPDHPGHHAADHDPRHEELLEALVTGNLSRDDEAAAGLLACPQCRDRIASFERLAAHLEQAGDEQRAILAEAVPEPASGQLPASVGTPRRWPIWVGVAAALLVVAVLFGPMRGCDPGTAKPDEGMTLEGGATKDGVYPTGDVPNFDRFEWQGQLAAGERFEVEVFDALTGARVASSPGLETNRWVPQGKERGSLDGCKSIRWEVRVRTLATTERRDLQRFSASRPQ